jgi:hypothetical protein
MAALDWTLQSAPLACHDLVYLAAEGVLCALRAGTSLSPLMTSPDGAIWTTRSRPSTPATNGEGSMRRLAASEGAIIGTLSEYENLELPPLYAPSPQHMLVSSNGASWSLTDRDPAFWYEQTFGCATWRPAWGFLAIATNADGGWVHALYSASGDSWTATEVSDNDGPTRQWYDLVWSESDEQFVAVASDGVHRSADGLSWDGGSGPDWLQALTYSPARGLYVAVGSTSIMTSPDGTTWTEASSLPSGHTHNAVCWAASLGIFVAVGAKAGSWTQLWSADGQTWQETGVETAHLSWSQVLWVEDLSLFVAVSGSPHATPVMTGVFTPDPPPQQRVTQLVSEVVSGPPTIRVTQLAEEVVSGPPTVRLTQLVTEVVHAPAPVTGGAIGGGGGGGGGTGTGSSGLVFVVS